LANKPRSRYRQDGFPISTVGVEALRRYLETHRDELMEHFIREDVEWGLHGNE